MRRFLKFLLYALAAVIFLPILVIGYDLISERIAYQRAEITSVLIRDGKYDPAEHYAFERGCIFPPEWTFTGEPSGLQYRHLDQIFPESHVHWTLVLIDDKEMTFRTLYIVDRVVRFNGQSACSPKITLRTKLVDGVTVAYVPDTNLQ